MDFSQDNYIVRKKFLKILGAKLFIELPDGKQIANAELKAFKLKEDIRLYADETKTQEILRIHARSILDLGTIYDVFDSPTSQKIGSLKRNFGKSLLRDSWEIWDVNENMIGEYAEDSMALALIRRFLLDLLPQTFTVHQLGGAQIGEIKQNFNPFTVKLDVNLKPGQPIDRRLVLVGTILLASIEGRQG